MDIRNALSLGAPAGILATLVMDGMNWLLSSWGLISHSHPSSIGRIFYNWSQGRFINRSFFELQPSAHEFWYGLAGHYAIGAALAVLYVLLSHALSGTLKAKAWPLAYGVLTSVFAWFLMFPSVGLGLFGLDAPPQVHLFRTSLVNHLSYGLGLAIAFNALASFAPVRRRTLDWGKA